MIAGAAVLKANPDGYTLLASSDGSMVHGPLELPNPPYDTFKDFLHVGGYGVAPHVYTVYASSPFKTIVDFVREAKKTPGKLSVGVTQLDSRLKVEKFEQVVGVDLKIIPMPTCTGISFCPHRQTHRFNGIIVCWFPSLYQIRRDQTVIFQFSNSRSISSNPCRSGISRCGNSCDTEWPFSFGQDSKTNL